MVFLVYLFLTASVGLIAVGAYLFTVRYRAIRRRTMPSQSAAWSREALNLTREPSNNPNREESPE